MPNALVLWDGDCDFCARCVDFLKRRITARGEKIDTVPYQRAPSPPMTPELRRACAQSVHVLTPDGSMLHAGKATLYLLGRIGFAGPARVLSLPPLIWGVELAYRIVAANRPLFSRIIFPRAAKGDACSISDHDSSS